MRLVVPGAASTAVMTGNLTNAVLSFLQLLEPRRPLMQPDAARFKKATRLVVGFCGGCRWRAGILARERLILDLSGCVIRGCDCDGAHGAAAAALMSSAPVGTVPIGVSVSGQGSHHQHAPDGFGWAR
jgi:hypothetical protein